jgi:hypothetical protein
MWFFLNIGVYIIPIIFIIDNVDVTCFRVLIIKDGTCPKKRRGE